MVKFYIGVICVVVASLKVLAYSNSLEKKVVYSACLQKQKLVELDKRLTKVYSPWSKQRIQHKRKEVKELCATKAENYFHL